MYPFTGRFDDVMLGTKCTPRPIGVFEFFSAIPINIRKIINAHACVKKIMFHSV